VASSAQKQEHDLRSELNFSEAEEAESERDRERERVTLCT